MSEPVRRGLLLDLDGTLADSLSVLRQIYFDFLEIYGGTGSREEFEILNGPPLPEIVAHLRRAHHLTPPEEELLRRYRDMIRERQGQVAPARGAIKVLERAMEAGWKCAVVTSSAHEHTRLWLERHEIISYFALIVGGDDVRHGKPDPEPYRLAVERLGLEAGQCIAVEDSIQGARAAVSAGIPTRVLRSSAWERQQWPANVEFIGSLDDLVL